jgi:hypothetical protein
MNKGNMDDRVSNDTNLFYELNPTTGLVTATVRKSKA